MPALREPEVDACGYAWREVDQRGNNALYVVDGIPLPSLRSKQTEGIYETPDGGDYEGICQHPTQRTSSRCLY